jgi:hypothetical protein
MQSLEIEELTAFNIDESQLNIVALEITAPSQADASGALTLPAPDRK